MQINKSLLTWIIVLVLVAVGLVYRSTAQTVPGQTPPGQTSPGGQALPEQTAPGQTLPGQTLPGQTVPGQTLPGQTLGTGTLRLYLCDAPPEAPNITGVYITISAVQYHTNGQWATAEGFAGPQTYNLLELTGGNFALLGDLTLPVGNYTQIRFMLDIPEKGSHPANPGCYVEFGDNSTEPLFAPSGGETGYKATGKFEVTDNGTVVVTADFEVDKALVMAGSSYVLKPTIKLSTVINY
jgi:hypothetical protein